MDTQVTIQRNYRYDALNRLVSVMYETGLTVNYSYDAAGNRTAVAASMQQTPENMPERKDTRLIVTCPICKGSVTPGNRFCGHCGAKIG